LHYRSCIVVMQVLLLSIVSIFPVADRFRPMMVTSSVLPRGSQSSMKPFLSVFTGWFNKVIPDGSTTLTTNSVSISSP
jgi:hypothetical protein